MRGGNTPACNTRTARPSSVALSKSACPKQPPVRLNAQAWNDKAPTCGAAFCWPSGCHVDRSGQAVDWVPGVWTASPPPRTGPTSSLVLPMVTMGSLGAVRIAALAVKCSDRRKTNQSDGIPPEGCHRSRTRVWGSKMIRYHRSP